MRLALAWVQAARLPSLVYLLGPLALGQALAVAQGAPLSPAIGCLVMGHGVLTQLFIVFANDVADEAADRLNPRPTFLSGGSRVLVEGRLPTQALARAARAAALGALGCAAVVAALPGRGGVLILGALGLALLWAYSFPPLRLSYRGGGEALQATGTGLVLPLLGYWAQAGQVAAFPWPLLAAWLPLQLATAMATAVPDEAGDRLAAKRTLVVCWGARRAGAAMLGLLAGGLLAWAWARPGVPGLSWPAAQHAAWALPGLVVGMGLWGRGWRPAGRMELAFVLAVIATGLGWLLALGVDLAEGG